MDVHIAVDIGGTQIRAATYPLNSLHPLNIRRLSTNHPTRSPLERLIEVIASVWSREERVAAIGVAAPGPLDPYQGIMIDAPNIPDWENLPLARILEEQFQVPVALGNDANLAALGEWQFGVGQGHHHLIYLTVSTGIGGGIIVDDQLVLGHRGLAAELGHVTVLPDGPLCGCGRRGHLEAVASGTAITNWVQQELASGVSSILIGTPAPSAKDIAQAAKAGDSLAINALARAGAFIGQALADFLHIINPSLVIFGGGVSQSGDLLLNPVRESLMEHVMNPYFLNGLSITAAALGDEAGLMGSLALARQLTGAGR